jgi:hypothetical protein
MWLAVAAGALMFIGCWVGLGGHETSTVALPRFEAPPAPAAAPAATRTGLLPDCSQLLPESIDPAALLAQPTGSVAVHPVIGTPAPSVAMLARTSCTYHRAGAKTPGMLGQVNLSAFADPAAAESQRRRNLAVEQSDPATVATPVALGAAQATMLTSPTTAIMMTSYDRYTVTVSLPRAMFPADEESDVLVDLTRRALASTVVPAQPAAAQPAPSPARAQPAPAPAPGRVSPALAKG